MQTSKKNELHVWVLSDGRPGHFNASKGTLNALKLEYEVTHDWVEVRLRSGALRRILRMILNMGLSPDLFLLKLFYQLPELPHNKPDLILSAGGKTSFLNAALGRLLNCKTIFVGSLRGLSHKCFSAVVTLENLEGIDNNIVVELAPSVINADDVAREGDKYAEENSHIDEHLWFMVIGGDGAGYHYNRSDWKALAKSMEILSERYKIKWLLTTSGRTGKQVEDWLCSDLGDDYISEVVWYAKEPRKIMKPFLGMSELVFCTEDSMTMLTESVTSGKPVISLSPEKYGIVERYQSNLLRMERLGLIKRLPLSDVIETDIDNVLENLRRVDSKALSSYLCNQIKKYIN